MGRGISGTWTVAIAAAALVAGLGTVVSPPAADAADAQDGSTTRPAQRSTDMVVADGDPVQIMLYPDTGTARRAIVITCIGKYDHPHPSGRAVPKYSTINAHLVVTCTPQPPYAPIPMTSMSVKSRMKTPVRRGAWSRKLVYQKRKVKVGGDLRCVRVAQRYRAKGRFTIDAPPGYTPPVVSAKVRSKAIKFRKRGGRCRRV